MYLQGKLNQNAHITLRALEDWQQLNLSVKNLVKELKTFDLPVDEMIHSKRYLLHLEFVTVVLLLHMIFFTHFHSVLQSVFTLVNICGVFLYVSLHLHLFSVCQQKNASSLCFYVYVCACHRSACDHVCVAGASVKRIVSKWQRGSRENDGYVCGLITINSPFDCNWCLNLRSPPPLGRPLVPPSILSF